MERFLWLKVSRWTDVKGREKAAHLRVRAGLPARWRHQFRAIDLRELNFSEGAAEEGRGRTHDTDLACRNSLLERQEVPCASGVDEQPRLGGRRNL